jgi:hypothetical protein
MSWFTPPPEGFHDVVYNNDGTMKGRIDPKEQTKKETKLKSDMEKYFAKSREAQEKLRRSAAGIKEETQAPAPKDVLGLIEMNFLADPALLQGKGAVPLQMLSEAQKRAQRRASLDAQSAKARKELDGFLKGDEDDEDDEDGFNFDTYEGISTEAAESIINSDDDDDDDYSFLDEYDDETENE